MGCYRARIKQDGETCHATQLKVKARNAAYKAKMASRRKEDPDFDSYIKAKQRQWHRKCREPKKKATTKKKSSQEEGIARQNKTNAKLRAQVSCSRGASAGESPNPATVHKTAERL